MPTKVAFFAHPLPYGLYTVFRNLRRGLPGEFELRWVGHGAEAERASVAAEYESEQAYGEVVPGCGADDAATGRALVRHLLDHGYALAVINPPQTLPEMNVARYLPAGVRRVAVVHSTSPGAYRMCKGLRDHVHATVGVSPRTRDDLVAGYGFPPEHTHAIANGLDLTPYDSVGPRAPRGGVEPLRLLSFGRIDEATKLVFCLPEIMRRLADAPVHLTVAGDGPDLAELRRRFAAAEAAEPSLRGRVEFTGVVPPARIPSLVSSNDAFILTSRREGLPCTVIEAMAGGCVPVVSRIRGVTDFIVSEGRTGLLFAPGDVAAAAAAVRRLVDGPALLSEMSDAAREECGRRFTAEAMGAAYAEVFRKVLSEPRPLPAPLPLERWNYPRALRPGWRRFIPRRAKDVLRRWYAR